MMEGYMLCIDGRFIFVNVDIFFFSSRFDSVCTLHKLRVSSQLWWAIFFCFAGANLKIDITTTVTDFILNCTQSSYHSIALAFQMNKETEKNEWRNKNHFQSSCLHHFALKEQYLIIYIFLFFLLKKEWFVNVGGYGMNGRAILW